MQMTEPTHRIDHYPSGEEYIECLRCGLKSFNKNDIAQKYCGKCSGFHPLPQSKKEE
jgi:ribosomal protein L37E